MRRREQGKGKGGCDRGSKGRARKGVMEGEREGEREGGCEGGSKGRARKGVMEGEREGEREGECKERAREEQGRV